jgi:hypothetical protein
MKYPLRVTKYLDFLDFIHAMSIFEQKINRTVKGLNPLYTRCKNSMLKVFA